MACPALVLIFVVIDHNTRNTPEIFQVFTGFEFDSIIFTLLDAIGS